ncbi:MAG: Mth938-like domain-containing protein [Candidatus Altiarchaeota archaeon]|nr:Mth938-like domain-containing protein [Candidatus Altiarchaeota archaeon]
MRVDSYDFGRIVIDGKAYTSDVVMLEDHVESDWWRKEGHRLLVGDISEIIGRKPDLLIIGTGNSGMMSVPPETRKFIESRGVELIVERTGKACSTYNRMFGEKKVIAALHLTC